MNRKQFIESQGATCKNWNWSWSFVNHEEKIVIFGAWDSDTDGSVSLILGEWKVNYAGRKLAGYPQAREHIRLVEDEGYALKIFPMTRSDAFKNKDGLGPAKIGKFEPVLFTRQLKRIGDKWYASDGAEVNRLPEEVDDSNQYPEGALKTVVVNAYERNRDARVKCLEYHGYECAVCSFDFEKVYGSLGEQYIHVHHRIPLGEVKKEYNLDPIEDLVPVCPNCHAMIHRAKPALTVDEVRIILED